ncbi:hypothetical protein Q0Z83_021970 [Actinoplanes sichuanensis]|uniref:SLATT domain-containing protein n=1 Tax=Actinoplanes sichuanensis TaxID=512349 RepID=A0ABW4AI86_9ACTN|nr:DUF4231 domain-containing protein [Actinoplanes sichuanensis]BEL04006.1 hypothetical protein Q0Z83_021970 [Actinoplanes sichuanensis]
MALRPDQDAVDPVLTLADRELDHYARRRDAARVYYQATELALLVTASATVIAAAMNAPPLVTALIAGTTVFFTGFRQVFRTGERWTLSAQSRVSLWHATNQYRLLEPEERDPPARQRLLDSIQRISEQELQGWAATRTSAEPVGDRGPGVPLN